MRSRALVFGLVVIVLAGAAMFFVSNHRAGDIAVQNSTNDASTTLAAELPVEATSSEPQREVPAGFKEYVNARYHFSLLYPQDLEMSFTDEGAGAGTITFQNVAAAQGFQIFVVPYNGNRISEQRFHTDEPSGVRDNDVHIEIDGAGAEAFYSRNAALGDTAEIWYMHDGLLYEVTTLKSLDTWLSNIMGSWKFI